MLPQILDVSGPGESGGEAVCHGGHRGRQELLFRVLRINQGLDVSKAMFAAFAAADLIEPMKLEIKFAEEQYNLVGLHTINREKLANLDAETLHKLHRAGFLHGAYLVVNSLGNVQRLVERKQRRRLAQAAMAS